MEEEEDKSKGRRERRKRITKSRWKRKRRRKKRRRKIGEEIEGDCGVADALEEEEGENKRGKEGKKREG